MQNSATKIIKFILNKKNVEKLYKNLSKQTVIPLILLSVLFIFSYYFLKPYFYEYNSSIKVIEKKIKEEFKLDIKINGKISYDFLPSPRIKIKKSNLIFESQKNSVFLEEINLLIPVLNNKNLEDLNFKKFYVKDNEIEIFASDFKYYFKYLTDIKKKDIIFKNCTLFFLDDQKTKYCLKTFFLPINLEKIRIILTLKVFFQKIK